MNIEILTQAFQTALANAQSLAVGSDHAVIEPEHVLKAMSEQVDSSIPSILRKLNVALPTLQTKLFQQLQRFPKVEGQAGNVHLSNTLNQVLNVSDALAQKQGDQYISSEWFLPAVLKVGGELARLLKSAGVQEPALMQAISEVRGGQNVTSESAEGQREALQKYTIDLTERALKSKLDPVIGRDDIIRRVIQVLQRRTKNNPVLIGEPIS